MERPHSRLENARPSGLKPPSRVPAMALSTNSGLKEASGSQLNSIAGSYAQSTGSMAPPPIGMMNGKKHALPGRKYEGFDHLKEEEIVDQLVHEDFKGMSQLDGTADSLTSRTGFGALKDYKLTRPPPAPEPHPPAKKERKTLAERAGEPIAPSHLTRPQLRQTSSTQAVVGMRLASNTSIHPTSATSTSMRPPSRQLNGRANGMVRPPSVVEDSLEERNDGSLGLSGKRQGTPLISFTNNLTLRKTRTHGDIRSQADPSRVYKQASQNAGSEGIEASGPTSNGGYIRAVSSGSSVSNASSTHSRTVSASSTSSQQSVVVQKDRNRDISLSNALQSLHITARKPSKNLRTPQHRPSLSNVTEESNTSPSKIPKAKHSLQQLNASQPPYTTQNTPCAQTPNFSKPLLRHAHSSQALQTPTSLRRTPALKHTERDIPRPVYLTKESLTPIKAWDTKGRLEDVEHMYGHLRTQFTSAGNEKNALEEALGLYKQRVNELTDLNQELQSSTKHLTADLDRARADLHTTAADLAHSRRDHEREVEQMRHRHQRDLDQERTNYEREASRLEADQIEELARVEGDAQQEKQDLEQKHRLVVDEQEEEYARKIAEMAALHLEERQLLQRQVDDMRADGDSRASESKSEVDDLRSGMVDLEHQLDTARFNIASMERQLAGERSKAAALDTERATLVSKTHFLEGNQEAQSLEFTTLSDQLQAAILEKEATLGTLRKEELLRRKLNATILELRGNIRVFVRIRPVLSAEEADVEKEPARLEFPDADALDGAKEMVVHAPPSESITGQKRNERWAYEFDRIFPPETQNPSVFEHVRDLVQSVIDGYNVSILSYGQTGAGKTFGMSGDAGIIPCSIQLLLSEITRLSGKGWAYEVEASFLEVYCETINDLLGNAKEWDYSAEPDLKASKKGKDRHEIHHDALTGKTTVSNLTGVSLWPPPAWDSNTGVGADNAQEYTTKTVESLLSKAAANRRTAATKSNERSSRSHSVFQLTLKGKCTADGKEESSEGVLYLVDLAGSERLKASGAQGQQATEAKAINKSLSSLGDVVAALGNKTSDSSHVPYRNSKLTYLLQSSLGGTANGRSSRTLMLLHLSPLQQHQGESRSSLLFGQKVRGTHIGAAKKSGK